MREVVKPVWETLVQAVKYLNPKLFLNIEELTHSAVQDHRHWSARSLVSNSLSQLLDSRLKGSRCPRDAKAYRFLICWA